VLANDPQQTTNVASHELAEAITDPQVDRWETLGWYDDQNGEIGDIPVALYNAGRISEADWVDTLKRADGTEYQVQKEWSNRDGAPVAFGQKTMPAPSRAGRSVGNTASQTVFRIRLTFPAVPCYHAPGESRGDETQEASPPFTGGRPRSCPTISMISIRCVEERTARGAPLP